MKNSQSRLLSKRINKDRMIEMKPNLELQAHRDRQMNKSVRQREDELKSFINKLEKRENNFDQMMKALKQIRGK